MKRAEQCCSIASALTEITCCGGEVATEQPNRYCEWCEKLIPRNLKVGPSNYIKKRFCSKSCSTKRSNINRGVPVWELVFGVGRYIEVRCSRIGVEGDCWIWQGTVNPRWGYGQVQTRGVLHRAHKLAFELVNGPVPEGKELHHRCEMKLCINPAHLQPLTKQEHGKYSKLATATHCKNGHEFTTENAIIRTTRSGTGRECRTCHSSIMRHGRAKRKTGLLAPALSGG